MHSFSGLQSDGLPPEDFSGSDSSDEEAAIDLAQAPGSFQ